MSTVVRFKGKKREEYIRYGSQRVSFSEDDILVEDFYEDKNHPYAIYNLHGKLLETNLRGCKNSSLQTLYNKHSKAILHLIKEFGVDV